MEESAPAPDATSTESSSVGGGETTAPASIPNSGSILGGAPSANPEPIANSAPDAIPTTELWHETLPDEFKNSKNISKYNSLDEMLRGHENLSKKIGEKNLEMPGEDASTADWDKFYSKVGRPDSVDGYSKYEPDMVVDGEGNEIGAFEFDPNKLAEVQKRLHAKGASDSVMQEVMSSFAEISTQERVAALDIMDQKAQQAESELRREYGDKYEAQMKSVGAIAESLGIKDTLLEAGLGNDLSVIRMLQGLGSKIGESAITGDARGAAGGYESRMAALKAHPAAKSKSHPEFHSIQSQITNLYKEKYGS
jgi:hypothetical protein